MSALYVMRYVGQTGTGTGVMYIGKGLVVGMDAAGNRYDGSYSESGGRIRGNVTMSVQPGTVLVTGQVVPQAAYFELKIDWLGNFANGKPQQITIAGRSAAVLFEKLKDIP
jgi:hypothetical protein